MSFTLQVTLEGVLALVPDQPFFLLDDKTGKYTPGKPSQVTVLLPDVLQSAPASWSTKDVPVLRSSHWPILIFDLVDYDPSSTRSIDLVVRDLATGTDRGVVFLDHEQINLPYSSTSQPFKPALAVPADPDYPDLTNRAELTSLWWVPQMSHLFPVQPTVGKANDPNSQDFRFGDGNSLIAAVTLDQGRFYVRDFNRLRDGSIRSWEFGYFDAQGNRLVVLKRPIGNQLALDLEVPAAAAEFTLTEKKKGAAEHQLLLRPPAGSDKRQIQVRVANIEPETLRLKGTPLETRVCGGDPDFEVFYSMANISLGKTPVPLFPSGGGIGRLDKPCSSSASTGF